MVHDDHHVHDHASPPHRWHDMSLISWAELWDKQSQRLDLADEWWKMAGGRPGARVADVGCGPGRVALRYAELAGPTGFVLAVDPEPDAIAFLKERRERSPVGTLVLDAQKDLLPGGPYDAAFLTNVLHHVEHPLVVLKNLSAATNVLVIAEFDPLGAGEFGPPLVDRVPPARLAAWLHDAGWHAETPRKQAMEIYSVRAMRP